MCDFGAEYWQLMQKARTKKEFVHDLTVFINIRAQKPAIKRLRYQWDNRWHLPTTEKRCRCGAFFAFEPHHLQ